MPSQQQDQPCSASRAEATEEQKKLSQFGAQAPLGRPAQSADRELLALHMGQTRAKAAMCLFESVRKHKSTHRRANC